jgi:hypothetical protein
VIERLLKELASGSQTLASLSARMDSFSFAALRQDDAFTSSIGGLTDLSTVSVVDLFGGKRLVTLASFGGWSALITSHTSVAEQVHSLTGLIGLVNLTSEQSSGLDIYHIEGVSTADPLKARGLRLDPGQTISIEPLSPYVPRDMDSLYRVRSRADQSIWLIIAEPSTRPYFHAFSIEARDYLYSAFPNNVGASAHYLAELVKQYVYASDPPASTRAAVVELGRFIASLEVTPSTGKWNVAQALSRISPDDALDVLEALARDGNGIGERARELMRQQGRQDAAT